MRKIKIEVNKKTIGTKLKCQLPDIKMQNLIINKKLNVLIESLLITQRHRKP